LLEELGVMGVSRVFLHDRVVCSPIQLVEGLHVLPKNLVDRIDWRKKRLMLNFVKVLEFLGQTPHFFTMPQ